MDHGQPSFEYLHSWRIHNLPRKLFLGLNILMVKTFFFLFLNYTSSISVYLAYSLTTLRTVRLHLLHALSAAGVQAETFLVACQISLKVSLILPNPIPAYSKSISILPSAHLTLLLPLECLPLCLRFFRNITFMPTATSVSFSACWVGLELGVGDLWKSKLTDRTRCTLKTRI